MSVSGQRGGQHEPRVRPRGPACVFLRRGRAVSHECAADHMSRQLGRLAQDRSPLPAVFFI